MELLLIFGPALLGVIALVGGIYWLSQALGQRPRAGRDGDAADGDDLPTPPSSLLPTILGVGLLVVAFGIGACYVVVFTGLRH